MTHGMFTGDQASIEVMVGDLAEDSQGFEVISLVSEWAQNLQWGLS